MHKQKGAILIVVLWVIALAALLVAVMASNVRYSANTVIRHKELLQQSADMMQAVNMAQMELLLERMPKPPGAGEEEEGAEKRKTGYIFNGQALKLHYPQPENIVVRIYDHAGKINLRNISRQSFYDLLETRMGQSKTKEINTLLDAWQDWLDFDDLKRINGAEKKYYETLEPPYQPRNAQLETVEEILDIKGFREVFGNENLQASFTIYGSRKTLNPNLASREALMLLPDMDATTLDSIMELREKQEIKSSADLGLILTPEQMSKSKKWFSWNVSNYYTIVVYPKAKKGEEETQYAYMVNVQLRGVSRIPEVLQVLPYVKRPAS